MAARSTRCWRWDTSRRARCKRRLRACARRSVKIPSPLTTHLVHLAQCEDKAGLHDDALQTLRRAFEVALADNPIGQDVALILFTASALIEPRDMSAALDLHDATQALLDAQRARFGDDDAKIAFDEAANHAQIAQTLVGRLAARDELGAALVAADRTRARVLLELLGAPSARASASYSIADAAPDPPLDPDPVKAFRDAAAIVRRAAARVYLDADAVLPLDRDALIGTVLKTGRPAYLLQPEGDRLHLFLVIPTDDRPIVLYAASPVAYSEVAEAIRRAQSALGVFALARARGDRRLRLADIDDEEPELDAALELLSRAIIAPLASAFSSVGMRALLARSGLTLLPYRELALLPYGLLRMPSGGLLIEEAALCQMPSIASLRAICFRKRPKPKGCVVFGAPTLDARHRLEDLPGAAAEASDVATVLESFGVAPGACAFRTGPDATESAFRDRSVDAALVHLACHAAAREPASQSALYLAASGTHDGLLVPHEIAQAQLANAFVFLSACQTGLGRATADGVIGLGRAFLQAGALAVALSLWRVVDAAALHLAGVFYRRALGVGGPAVDCATALQQAMLATRDALRSGSIRTPEGEPLDDHPAHWAPFALVGEGGMSIADHLADLRTG